MLAHVEVSDMKIGEIARAAGISSKAIRFYEDFGLLPDPGRTESGHRQYGPDTIERLGFVTRAKQREISLEEIRGILDIHDRHEPTCIHVRDLLEQKDIAHRSGTGGPQGSSRGAQDPGRGVGHDGGLPSCWRQCVRHHRRDAAP